MWYVIQVEPSHELEMVRKCKTLEKQGEEVFTMLTVRQERKNGIWEKKQSVTFQKYIFVDTDEPDDFRIRLQSISGLTKMLGIGETVVPIYPKEEELLKRLGGPNHIIEISEGYYEDDHLVITGGPIKRLEEELKWIDNRQKVAGVAVNIMNREEVIRLGADFTRDKKPLNPEDE